MKIFAKKDRPQMKKGVFMISFVIPCFNSANTIERAINSILNQTEKELEYEILVIDDGSTDDLDEKMQQFYNNPKVKYYKKENSGVADTRNFGVEKAEGQYIIFVDSDDYIKNTLVQDIRQYIENDIDLIKWNVTFVDENQNELLNPQSVSFNLLFGKDNLIDCLWKYAIKKELIPKFPTGTYHEDFAVLPIIILKAKSFVSIENREYFYVQTANSVMRTKAKTIEKKKIQDKLMHFDNLIKQSNSLELSKTTKENLQIFATNSILAVVSDLNGENKKFYLKELKRRKIGKYIKVRNLKQLLKKLFLSIKY